MKALSWYNCDTGEIVLSPSATLYARFHEEAHKEQHQTKCLFFRLWWYGRWIRGVQWVVTVLIELDAYRRARRNMIRLDLWNAEADTEGRHDISNYFTKRALFDNGINSLPG
jgi:hypothetical protein